VDFIYIHRLKEIGELGENHVSCKRIILLSCGAFKMDQCFSRSCKKISVFISNALNTSHMCDSLICTTRFIYYL
jgi:hypothetical protein